MINDQDPDQGNTSVVYGSHQQLNGPDSVGEWRPEERGKSLGQDPHEMPGHVQFTGKAGDGKLDAPARSARDLPTLTKVSPSQRCSSTSDRTT